MVIVDTSVWIDYFSGRSSEHATALSHLIRRGLACVTGVVLAELLRGRRTVEERELLEGRLGGATFIEMSQPAWRRAGMIASELDSRGEPIALADVIIAALALEVDSELFTLDTDFQRIPALRLYDWKDPDA